MFATGHTPRPHLTAAAKARAVENWINSRRITLSMPANPAAKVSKHGRPYLAIDRAVPLPKSKGPAFARPFALMEPGDSFFEPLNGLKVPSVAQRIRWDAKHYAPARFKIIEETQDGIPGLRVWRIA